MSEIWRAIPGLPKYEVSDLGRIRSFKSGACRILKLSPDKNGYPVIHPSGHTPKFVHRLVMLAFVGPCPEGLEVCHGPGGQADNRPSNLRYDTRKGNLQDAVRSGNMGKGLSTEQIVNLHSKGHTVSNIAKMFNVSRASIYHHLRFTLPFLPLDARYERAKQIREAYATGRYTKTELAKKYRMSTAAASQIINGKRCLKAGGPIRGIDY